ncbi:DNA repair ATPase, partial [Pseudomonas aeruginosa]
DLTLMPRGDALYLHLTGTDFLEPLQDPRLDELREFWQVNLESESETLYRAEYLAGEVLAAADAGRDGFSLERLQALLAQPDELARAIRDFAAPRYKEGYEKGIHDHDAAAILVRLLPLRESAGLLRYAPSARAFASLFWSRRREEREVAGWPERARSSRSIQQMFGRDDGLLALRGEVAVAMRALLAEQPIALDPQHIDEAAEYLVWELSAER